MDLPPYVCVKRVDKLRFMQYCSSFKLTAQMVHSFKESGKTEVVSIIIIFSERGHIRQPLFNNKHKSNISPSAPPPPPPPFVLFSGIALAELGVSEYFSGGAQSIYV